MTKTVNRDGDKLVITQVVDATIEFQDILDCVKLEFDDDYDALDCDGLEHEINSLDSLTSEFYNDDVYQSLKESRGYVTYDRKMSVIQIDRQRATSDHWGAGKSRGASKQVVAELIAYNIGTTTDYIKRIIEGNVYAYGIICDYTAPDGGKYHDSCWGYESDTATTSDTYEDCSDPHIQDSMLEAAFNVAHELENQGYTIVNKPGKGDAMSAADKFAYMRNNKGDHHNHDWPGEYQSAYKAKERHARKLRRKGFKPVTEIVAGDKVNLDTCPYLKNDTLSEFDLGVVNEVEREKDYILVHYNNSSSIGYSPYQWLQVEK